MVTMNDVARAAGVSSMTVSNVVNGRSGVSDEVRRRVLRELERSGYRMNVAARTLRAGRSGVIGLAVPELDRPYFGQLGALVTAAAAAEGYRVAVEETGAQAEGELAAIRLSQTLSYDGLILSAVGLDLQTQLTDAGQLPIVLLGERVAPTGVDHVALPNHEGARAATALLIERGCRRIALVGGRPTDATTMRSLRLGGYRAALQDAGLPYEADLVIPTGAYTMAEGRRAGAELGARGRGSARVDGVVGVTDTVAIGVARGLADVGVRVPADMLLAGFDDVPEAEYLTPSLTTVAPDHAWVARRAVGMLLGRLDGSRVGGGDETAPFTLVERESTRR